MSLSRSAKPFPTRTSNRDLKPENILFNQEREALLADFGIAMRLSTASAEHLTTIGGTPSYMAPEQFQGTVSKEGDQYALGCIAYELVTGQPPFTAPDPTSMGLKHLTEEPISPTLHNPHVSAAIEAAILKALAKQRIERYSSVKDFVEALGGGPLEGEKNKEGVYRPSQQEPLDENDHSQESHHQDPKQALEGPERRVLKDDNVDKIRIILPGLPEHSRFVSSTPLAGPGNDQAIPPSPWADLKANPTIPPSLSADLGTDQTVAVPLPTSPPPADAPPSADPGASQVIVPETVRPRDPIRQSLQHALAAIGGSFLSGRRPWWRLGIEGGVTIALIFLIIFAAMNWWPRPQPTTKAYCIGTDFPTSGADTTHGTPSRMGADLAIAQNHNLGSGYTLNACDKDNTSIIGLHDPVVGGNNVTQFVNDPRIIGIVGPQDSNVARDEIPIAARASLPIISPSATDPCLTLAQYCRNPNAVHPYGMPNTFFRVCGNTSQQALAGAQFLLRTLHVSKDFFIVDDGETEGEALTDAFSRDMKGKILGVAPVSSRHSLMQISSLAREIISSQAKVVLYGGTTSNGGGMLAEQLTQMGFTGSFIGSDGIAFDQRFLLHAGSTVNYVYATSMQSAHPHWSPEFITSYQNHYHKQPTPNSAAGYDAAMILITALKSVIKSDPPTDVKKMRQAVLDKIADPDQPLTGLNGPVAFDSNGDNTMMRTLSVYAIENGQWTYKSADSVDMG